MDTSNPNDLITKKIDGFKSEHPTLTNAVFDELISAPNLDSAQSTRFMHGIQKRTAMFPGGSIVTNLINVATPATTIFAHWHGFLLASKPAISSTPGADELLHGWDSSISMFSPFADSTFTLEIRNSTNTATVATITMDTEQSVALPAADYRLRFTNNSLDRVYFLSDWLLLRN